MRVAAARERREGTGPAGLLGAGEEFVGYRPYRPGEDLRQLDWNLLARLDRPFVRVTRREAGERWVVLVDTSASMGVGVPGKLQTAAEIAVALASVGLRAGARTLVQPSVPERAASIERPRDVASMLAWLEELRADGTRGVSELCSRMAHRRGAFEEASRVFVVGDLWDCEPREVLTLNTRSRHVTCVQLFATAELAPGRLARDARGGLGAIAWRDPEDGARVELNVDPALAARYEEELGQRLELWGRSCVSHGVGFGCWDAHTPFERIVEAVLAR